MLTPTVAIFGIYIAYRQWRTEETRLRHELFERRYKQFNAVVKFVLSAMSLSVQANEDYTTYEEGDSLWSEIAGMQFIFTPEIQDYVDTYVIVPYEEIQQLRSQYNGIAPGEERQKNAARQGELKMNLRESLKEFQEKTSQYMQLQQSSILQKIQQYLPILCEKIKKAAD
jgi:hypothetical protein